MKIKVGTYNICHCADYSDYTKESSCDTQPSVLNIKGTADIIKSLSCDVIGLNEVYENGSSPRDDFKFQTKKLAALAGYPFYYYAQGHDYDYTDIGNAILSKFPIKRFETVKIPTVPESERTGDYWYENRILAIADVDFNGKIVKVIGTHFGLAPIELERIVNKCCNIIDGTNLPVVLMGDFNVFPDNPLLEKISERLKSAAAEKNNSEFTWSTYNPHMQIDYIFVPKNIEVVSYEVHKLKISDHRPITAEIKI